MVKQENIVEFEWDEGNIDKNYEKHGTSIKEAEEIFLDEDLLQLDDVKHSQTEKRFTAIGRTFKKKLLFAAFTIIICKIRIYFR
jgi:hypothetical protein